MDLKSLRNLDNGIIKKRRIVLGITGSVAAYKGVELARILVSTGYEVQGVLTYSAQRFISPLLLESVTGRRVITDFWSSNGEVAIDHIHVADWADLVVVAPATADSIAKLSLGFAETPLLALALATRAPIIVAPAMNVNMFEHQKTQEHLAALKKRGITVVEPEEGELACGWRGKGRLPEPIEIFWCVRRALSTRDLEGKHIVITLGPTREAIDPVRYISNRSSGKMGAALAVEAFSRGAKVTVIHGPCTVDLPRDIKRIQVVSCLEMMEALKKEVFETDNTPDAVIMAAAVSDFKPKVVFERKIKKFEGLDSIPLLKNPDILAYLREIRGDKTKPLLVGFAVETGDINALLGELKEKLHKKGLSIIVGNLADDAFEQDTNRVWILDKNGDQVEIGRSFKSHIANRILDSLVSLCNSNG